MNEFEVSMELPNGHQVDFTIKCSDDTRTKILDVLNSAGFFHFSNQDWVHQLNFPGGFIQVTDNGKI
jgi:hypothetical protein